MLPRALGSQWIYPTALCIDDALIPCQEKMDEYMQDDITISSLQTNMWILLNTDLPHPIYGYILAEAAHKVVPNCIALQMLTHMSKEELSRFSTSIETYVSMLKYLNDFVIGTHTYTTVLFDKCTPLLHSVSPPSISNLVTKSLVCPDLSSVSPDNVSSKFALWYKEMISFLVELNIWVRELANVQSSFSPIIHSITNYSCLRDVCKQQKIAYQIVQFIANTEPIELWIEHVENFKKLEKDNEDSSFLNWYDQYQLIRRCLSEMESILSVSFVEGSNRIDSVCINADTSALLCTPQWSRDSDAFFKSIILFLVENKQFLTDYKAALYNLAYLDDLKRPVTKTISSAIPFLSADGRSMLDKIWSAYHFSDVVEMSLRNREHFNSYFYGVLEGLYTFDLQAILQNWIVVSDILPIYYKLKKRVEKIQSYSTILTQIIHIVDSLAAIKDEYIHINYDEENGNVYNCMSTPPTATLKNSKNAHQTKHCLKVMHTLLLKYLDITGLEYVDAIKHKYLQSYMLILLHMPKSSALVLSNEDIDRHILKNIDVLN